MNVSVSMACERVGAFSDSSTNTEIEFFIESWTQDGSNRSLDAAACPMFQERQGCIPL